MGEHSDLALFRKLSEQYSLIRLRGKKPIEKNWQQFCRKRRSFEEIGFQAADNAGIACGPASGVLVLDVDDIDLFQKTCGSHKWSAPNTRCHQTGSGKFHFLYRYPSEKVCPNKAYKSLGFDIRGIGGQIVAPGSIHPDTGGVYEVLGDSEIIDPPGWLLRLYVEDPLSGDGKNSSLDAASILRGVGKGERDNVLFKYACRLREKNLDRSEAEMLILQAARSCDPPFPESDALEKLKSAWKYKPREVVRMEQCEAVLAQPDACKNSFMRTDMGNGERFAAQHRGRVLYCHPWEKWFVWDGARWKNDNSGHIIKLAKKTVRSIYDEAAKCEDDDDRQRLGKWAASSESKSKIDSMLALARSEDGIPVDPDDLDADHWLLNCQNGTVDLKTGNFIKSNPDNRITKIVNSPMDPEAECPTWLAFLDRILQGNEETISFVQRAVGYSMTGDFSEQCLFFLYGTGSNGKSTFLDVLEFLMHDYAKRAEFSTFMVRRNEAVKNDIADLKGARFVISSEAEAGQKLAEGLVKNMTGDAKMKARFLFREFFEFEPIFKIWLAANHKPVIKGTDDGIWRRIRLIPFTVTIPDSEKDLKLKNKLKSELPGILWWAIRGCMDWKASGLGLCEEVRQATCQYRCEMDTLSDFLDDCCLLSGSCSISKSDLYEAYEIWAVQNGNDKGSKKSLGLALIEKGFRDTKSGSVRYWQGISLTYEFEIIIKSVRDAKNKRTN